MFSKNHRQSLHTPVIKAQENAKQMIDDYGHGETDIVLTQSKNFQYQLDIQSVGANKEVFQLKLSKKAKQSVQEFEMLLTHLIDHEKMESSCLMNEDDNDVLLTLFKGAFVQKLNESSTTVLIPGFGQLSLMHKGGVFFDKDHNSALLSNYDLILKVSENLCIQSLAVESLTLNGKKNEISGFVTTRELCINHELINTMGLRAQSITGTGCLFNQGRLELEGTIDKPAILGVAQIISEKNKEQDIKSVIESTHLHITSTNRGLVNGPEALFSVTKKLQVDQSENGLFLNAGQMIIQDGDINRYCINEENAELRVLNQLIITTCLNKGDVEAKNLLKFKTLHNMGSIEGKIIDIEDNATNDGHISLHELSGKGWFTNQRLLEFKGDAGVIGVYDFVNATFTEKKRATVKGGMITISIHNRKFANSSNSDIFCNDLCSARPSKHLLGDNRYQSIQNKGIIKTTSLTSDRWGFENFGLIETTSLTIPNRAFTNYSGADMTIRGAVTISSHEVIVLERTVIEKGILHNEGNMKVKDLLGSGKFINIPNKGEINFTGTQHNPSLVEIKEFDGYFNQRPSSVMCSLYETSLIWKNVNWTPTALKECMLPLAHTSWVLDNVTCTKPITIHNHGTIHLKDSTLSFASLINHGKIRISGGNYLIQNLSTTKTSYASSIYFQDKACKFQVQVLSHRGEILVEPDIKQKINVNSGATTGRIIGKSLVLDIQKSLTNEGFIALWNLDGYGKFTNKGEIQFTGDKQNHSTIRIKDFENGSNDVDAQMAKIIGSHIGVNGLSKTFVTHDNSDIVAQKLFFTKTGDLRSKMLLELKGMIHTNELSIDREEVVNLGVVETLIFSMNGYKLTNGSGALVNDNLDDKKGILHIGSSFLSYVQVFENVGTVMIDEGSFKQHTGSVINRGYWQQHGDIHLGIARLSNKRTGTLICKDGELFFGAGLQKNHGYWSMEHMTSFTKLSIENDGSLQLINGVLEFASLINFKELVLVKGEYAVNTFENHGLLRLLDDWSLVQGDGYFKHNPRKEHFLAFKSYQGTGEIECEKQLIVSMFPVQPKKISAKNGVIAHSSVSLTFDALMAIETPLITLKYSSHCPGFTTLKNYHFTMIKTLDLVIDGPFSLNHSFTAETITLDIKGKFTIGTSNTSMGKLAATNGPLTVKSWEIDASFGKIYSKGPMKLTTTNGSLICGSPLEKNYDSAKNIGFAKEYCDPVQWKYACTPVLDVNGAYIASDSSLDLCSSTTLRLSYGQTFSQGKAIFTADYIDAIRSIIHGRSTAIWKANRVYIGRVSEVYLQLGWMSNYYPNEYMWAAKSDESKIHFSGNILFDTPSLTLVASTISSLDKISIRYNGNDVDLLNEKPASVNMLSQSRKYYCHSPKIISGELIEITTGDFVITATMNSPLFSIQALNQYGQGSGTFLNPSRSRSTNNPAGPVVIDMTQAVTDFASQGGFFNQLANGKVVTDFPLGTASTPNPNQLLYLNDGKAPHEVVQQAALIGQHQRGQNFGNNLHVFNPLGAINLDSFIQTALSEHAGKVHFKDQFGDKYNGSDLYKVVMGNSGKWIQKHQTQTATRDDLTAMTGVMLMLQLQQDAMGIREHLKLVIGPDEINPYQSPGDISGGEFICHTDGEQTHLNNRVVMEDDITLTSDKGIKCETQTYEEIYEDKHISIHKVKAMPQQQLISQKGCVKKIADEDIVDIGTATEAFDDVIRESKNASIIEKTLILPTTITTRDEEDNGPLGSTSTTTTNVTHDFLQTTVKAGGKGHFKAKQDIDIEGSQHTAKELCYWGLNYKNSSVLVANKFSTSSEESGLFSDKSSSVSQETPAAAFAVAMADQIHNMCETISVNGAVFQANTYVDGSKDGGHYAPLVKEMKHHQQVTSNTLLTSLDAGQEGGQEVELKPAFHVGKIIHQSTKQLILQDKSRRKVKMISGTDNACGFIALQSHLGVAPEKAREMAVNKILVALDNPQIQQIVCDLIAPEIEDGAFGGDYQLGYLAGAQKILNEANLAEANQTQAMIMFREIFGQEETQGQTAKQLVEHMEPTDNAPLALHRAYRELQRAVQKIADIDARKSAWASKLDTVKQFILSVVAQPLWMLTNVPAYLKTPTGVMDALAYVLGLNVSVFTETDNTLSVIHAYEANPDWPTVELLHCEFIPNSGYKNHFNLLKKTESPKGMIFVNAEIDKQVTEIVGDYKEQFYALKKWNREWSEKTQVVPDAALVVIAIAVVVLTKGMGSGLVNGMMASGAATGAATATTLSATQIAMANVAFSSLAAKVSTSLLKTGDPIACVKEVLSKDNLKNWAITIASAGLAEKMGVFCDINMSAGDKAFVEHLQEQAIRNTSNLAVNTLAGQKLNEKILAQAVANTVVDAISARAANNQGRKQREQPVHPVLHGAGHALDAFGINYVAAKLLYEDDAIKIARDRAFGAFAAETIGGFILDAGETNPKTLENTADISRVATAAFGAALGLDVKTVDKGAMNALSNNLMTAAEEDEEKKKKKTLIQYIYGESDEADFMIPAATEMFAGQTVPKEGEQECRASKVPLKSKSSKIPISYYSDEYDRDVCRYPQKILGETQILLEFSQAILTGAAQGVVNGVLSVANTLLHPIDSVVMPISRLLYDASIISACHMNNSNPLFTFDPCFSEIDAVIRQVVINNPKLYSDATERMQTHVQGLQQTGQYFADAPWQEQVRMATEITTSIATSFYTPSAVIVSLKTMSNLHKTGLPFNPPRFLNYNGEKAQLSVPTFSYATIKSTQESKAFNFVITEDSRLIIGPTHYMRESPILNHLGETVRRIEINHHDLAMGAPVISAGEGLFVDGLIRRFNNKTGHYLVEGSHLKKLTEQVFKKNGFPEAVGKFEILPSMGGKSPAIIIRNPMELLPPLGVLGGALAITGQFSQEVNKDVTKPSESSKIPISYYGDEYDRGIYMYPHFLQKGGIKLSPNHNRSMLNVNAFNDEYDTSIYLSPKALQIAIKKVNEFISPYKHAMIETVSTSLHFIAETMTIIHMSNIHLRGPLKYVGAFAEVAAEIIHNPSGELMEKLVCGTTVGLTKEAINGVAAVQCGVAAGLASSATTTPAGGMVVTGIVVLGTYKVANKITTPIAHVVQKKCHVMFGNFTAEEQAINPVEHLKSTSQSNQLVNDGTELEFREYSVLPQFSFFKEQTKVTETTSKQSSQGKVYEVDEDFSIRSSKGNGCG